MHSVVFKNLLRVALVLLGNWALDGWLDAQQISTHGKAALWISCGIILACWLIWDLMGASRQEHTRQVLYNWRQRRPIMSTLLAGLIGFAIFALFWMLITRSPPPTRATAPATETATKADIESLRSHIERRPSDGSLTQTFPGLSVQFLLRINGVISGRRNYIFDIGDTEKSRFSAYILSDALVTALVDSAGQEYVLSTPLQDTGLFHAVGILAAEFGAGDGRAFMRIIINNRELNSLALPLSVNVGGSPLRRSDDLPGTVIGADLNLRNGGVFDATELLIYSSTMTADQLYKNLSWSMQRLTKQGFLRFSGNQFVQVLGSTSATVQTKPTSR